jgi:hypothetical protein
MLKTGDERGMTAIWGVLILIAFVLLAVWIAESGRMLADNVKVRTAADAASLAGASTATAVPSGFQIGPGNTVTVTSWNVVIDQQRADDAAQKLLRPNMPRECPDWSFRSQVVDSRNEYRVFLGSVRMPSLLKMFLGREVDLGAESHTDVAVATQ